MADAIERKARQRDHLTRFYSARVEAAETLTEKLEQAFGKVRAYIANTDNPTIAQAVGLNIVDHLLAESEKIPRSDT